jgi:hypothetical protein
MVTDIINTSEPVTAISQGLTPFTDYYLRPPGKQISLILGSFDRIPPGIDIILSIKRRKINATMAGRLIIQYGSSSDYHHGPK